MPTQVWSDTDKLCDVSVCPVEWHTYFLLQPTGYGNTENLIECYITHNQCGFHTERLLFMHARMLINTRGWE